MDITRNWRLKMSRRQLLATRNPETGAVMLPQQTESATKQINDVFVFEPIMARVEDDDVAYARAAR